MQTYGRQGDEYILTPEQIERYHRDGYMLLEQVMTEEEFAPIESEIDGAHALKET